jgi:Tol biopolymer transport system component
MREVARMMGTGRPIILLGVSMALSFLLSGLVSTEPSAQTTSPDGKIVYAKQGTEPSERCDGHPCGDIWVMDSDGTNQTNLTNTPDTNEGQPAWSPDGARIAFTGPGDLNEDRSGGLGDIYIMDADGTNRTNLTNTPDDLEYQPSWAPSGEQLTFVREMAGQIISEQPDIFVIDANGENANNLTQTDESESHPDWSPDGAKIAFAGVRDGGWEILTMDPDGQNEEILTGDGFDGNDEAPDWSPDGTKIVFMKESQVGGCCEPWEIWAVNRDGSGDTNLTNDPSYDMGPSWSPDGSEITFTSTRARTDDDPTRTDIYAMPAPTILPPPDQSASTTTLEQGEGSMELVQTTLIRRLTRGGLSSEPDWGRSGHIVCTIAGTGEGEVLTGTGGDDVICGFGGDDVIRSRGGGDTLRGGGDDDSMLGGAGADTLRGASGNDVLDARDDVRGNDLADGGLERDVCVSDRRDTKISCIHAQP